jgi:hypothetical protein
MVDLQKTQDLGLGPYTDTPEEIFSEIGRRLVSLQDFEMFLTFVAKVAFEKDSAKVKDAILKSDNKTMGQLLHVLRKQIDIADDFDSALRRALDARNKFVHEFSHIYSLHSQEGISGAIKFLLESMQDLEDVTNVMKAVILDYGRKSDVNDSVLEDNWREFGDLKKIESKYLPKIASLFDEKNSKNA